MASRLIDRIRAHDVSPRDLTAAIADCMNEAFPGVTDEDILYDESDPRRLVACVRIRTKCPTLPHDLILRTMVHGRKSGWFRRIEKGFSSRDWSSGRA